MNRNYLISFIFFVLSAGCGFHPAYTVSRIGACGICDEQGQSCAPHTLSSDSDKELTMILNSSEHNSRVQVSWLYCGSDGDECRLVKEQVSYTDHPGTYRFHMRVPWAGHFRKGQYRVIISTPHESRTLKFMVSGGQLKVAQ